MLPEDPPLRRQTPLKCRRETLSRKGGYPPAPRWQAHLLQHRNTSNTVASATQDGKTTLTVHGRTTRKHARTHTHTHTCASALMHLTCLWMPGLASFVWADRDAAVGPGPVYVEHSKSFGVDTVPLCSVQPIHGEHGQIPCHNKSTPQCHFAAASAPHNSCVSPLTPMAILFPSRLSATENGWSPTGKSGKMLRSTGGPWLPEHPS
jgi:hypothetical protein